MKASDVSRAVATATSIAEGLDLAVDNASVVQNSNKLALRLLPCDVFARVAHVGREVAQFEVELAQRLAESDSPLAALDPRVEPRVHERDGFVVTLWTFYEPVTPREVSPADYASALARLHAGMRKLNVTMPHFTDRVAEAEHLVANHNRAERIAEQVNAALTLGIYNPDEPAPVPCDAALRQWLKTYAPTLKPGTRGLAGQVIESHLVPHFRDRDLRCRSLDL